ncbi:hypothetical protein B9T31_09495 [Acinetobacter sp. ANC 4558]|uniref:tail completion protein gp17 n=1 Tax=Acinetobacter sp. ANC 4558 TaxID=1977876 RepID=UPI000A33AD43|nr:DUF3168 domain-containing protein [Acinetobacter sp. ANC 4558]OTG85820.1 hypothetical protein B9T31_09495 [Acinetobacter sp. ANC 4558]
MTAPIYELLDASEDVKSFLESGGVLRAYEFGLASDSPKKPYLVWQDISGTPQNNLDCPALVDHISIQFDVYAETPDDLLQIKNAVRRALEKDNSCTITGLRGNSRESDTKLYRTGFDTNWFVDR